MKVMKAKLKKRHETLRKRSQQLPPPAEDYVST